MSTNVHRPYLDKMSSRTSSGVFSRGGGTHGNAHILPDLMHTGLTPSSRTPPPSVMLPDGSLNKAFVGITQREQMRSVHRDVLQLESRPALFKLNSNKRIHQVCNEICMLLFTVNYQLPYWSCRV